VCEDMHGEGVVFDGVRGCACPEEEVFLKGRCVRGGDALCRLLAGEGAEFHTVDGCRCAQGYVPGRAGGCHPATDVLCDEAFARGAHFDGNRSCVCPPGEIVEHGVCLAGSDDLCKSRLGASALFNEAASQCECAAGETAEVDGVCTAGSDAACQGLKGANSIFDNAERKCACKPGFRVGVGGRCVSSVAGGASSKAQAGEGAAQENSDWDSDAEGRCQETLGEFGVVGADGECICAAGYEREKHGCVAGMDLQCQSAFGDGAFFDGDMCDCKEGFKIDKKSNICKRVKRKRSAASMEGATGGEAASLEQLQKELVAASEAAARIEKGNAVRAASMAGRVAAADAEEDARRARVRQATAKSAGATDDSEVGLQGADNGSVRRQDDFQAAEEVKNYLAAGEVVDKEAPAPGVASIEGLDIEGDNGFQNRAGKSRMETRKAANVTEAVQREETENRTVDGAGVKPNQEKVAKPTIEAKPARAAGVAGTDPQNASDPRRLGSEHARGLAQEAKTAGQVGVGRNVTDSGQNGELASADNSGGSGVSAERPGGASNSSDEKASQPGAAVSMSRKPAVTEKISGSEKQKVEAKIQPTGDGKGHGDILNASRSVEMPRPDSSGPGERRESSDGTPRVGNVLVDTGHQNKGKEGQEVSEEERARQLKQREERRKKREAERRWKDYFHSDAMGALSVLEKAKEWEAEAERRKKPLAPGEVPLPSTEAAVPAMRDEIAVDGATADLPEPQKSEPPKPAPLSPEEFQQRLAAVGAPNPI